MPTLAAARFMTQLSARSHHGESGLSVIPLPATEHLLSESKVGCTGGTVAHSAYRMCRDCDLTHAIKRRVTCSNDA